MDKIKIAHIITQLELGGAQENTLYTVTHLDPQVYDTYLITGPGGLLDQEAAAKLGDRLIYIKSLARPVNPWQDLLSLIRLYGVCRRHRFDIVHTHSSKAGILGRWAAKFSGTRLIIHTFHGFGFNDFQKPWTRWFYIWLEKITARISAKLIVVSQENIRKAQSVRIGTPGQFQVIHSGIKVASYQNLDLDIPAEKKKFGLPPSDPLVGMVACFKPQKAPLDFIKIAKKVSEKMPTVKFILVGDGELRPDIEKLIKELSLENTVILTGWRRDVNVLIQLVDIVVLTSLWEGLPRVILEAFVSGKPVICTPADGVKEVIKEGETGILVDFHNVDTFAGNIIWLIENPAQAKKIALAARRVIQGSFDIDVMVQEQDCFYWDNLR